MHRVFRAAVIGIATVFAVSAFAASGWIEPNRGQVSEHFDYLVRAQDLTALVAPDRLALRLPASAAAPDVPAHAPGDMPEIVAPRAFLSVDLELLGANADASTQSAVPGHGVSNYLLGRDSEAWTAGVPHLSRVAYREVYPGIDLVYRLNDGKLEYDFELAPGANASDIRLRLVGAQSFALEDDGQWVALTAVGELRQRAPQVFQLTAQGRVAVDGEFVRGADDSVGFALSAGVHDEPIVIDPIIEFSGYVGGSGMDTGSKMLQNAQGDYVVMGRTTSVDLPAADAGQIVAGQDIFVMQIDATTGDVDWVTYVGGSSTDTADNMEIDSQGNIVVVGYTESDDYPAVNAFQSTYAGAAEPSGLFPWDATVFKLSADGSALVFSTYLGGVDAYVDTGNNTTFGFEWARGVAIDDQNVIYVAGQTAAFDFPATQDFLGRSCMESDLNAVVSFVSDIFVAKFAPDGTRLAAVCIGGTERDGGRGVEVGADGSVYVSGFGRSADLPGTTGFYQPLPIEPLVYSPFVLKLDADLSSVIYATYVGEGIMQRVVVDSQGAVYGSGSAFTDLFPVTPGAFQTTFAGGDPVFDGVSDSFVFKLAPDGMSLDYATYLGGSRDDDLATIQVDAAGRAYLVGTTASPDFPLHLPIFDALGAVLAQPETMNEIADIGAVLYANDFSNAQAGAFFFVARDGVNRWFADNPQFDATVRDLGTETADSRGATIIDANLDGLRERLIFANGSSAQHSYAWDSAAEDYLRGADYGASNGDSRAIAAMFGSGGYYSDAVVANHGQPNEIIFNGLTTPAVVGRPDGNTTALAVASFGLGTTGQSIVFGNDGQDVRLYPYNGNGVVDPVVLVSNAGTAVSSLAAGDLDGDGLDELVIGNGDAPNQLVTFSFGVPNAPVDIGTDNDVTTSVLLVDADRDGDLDLLVGNAGPDRLYLNDGSGVLARDDSYAGDPGTTRGLTRRIECDSCTTPFFVNDAGVSLVASAQRAIYATVLNPTGTALEFSTLLDGGGDDYVFRGLSLAGTGRMLIAGDVNGPHWPQVGRSAAYSGRSDAIVMVLDVDEDDDGVLDGSDNCLRAANADQRDSNGDGYGNVCDADLNNDLIVNVVDLGLMRSVFFTADADADLNGDGVVNVQDLGLLKAGFFAPPGPSGVAP